MRRELFDYELPDELIASRPLAERDAARLLVLDPTRETLEHASVRDLERLIPEGALLVLNDTRVIPARLLGRKADTGGRAEIFLVERLGEAVLEHEGARFDAERWRVMGRASKPLRPGSVVLFEREGDKHPAGGLAARIESRGEDGLLEVALFAPQGGPIDAALRAYGHIPLPPYLRRPEEEADHERYQTVFARVPGAVAAPTAGLHFSNALLERLEARAIARAFVTLHVGLGTFQPVTVDDLDEHSMHAERFEISEETALAIEHARARGAAVIAVGTTVVRALESAADPERPGHVRPMTGVTRLLIQPGYAFRVVDQLLTNFHLPQSTLLALVAAFAGRERMLSAYCAAVDARYRFFSYGDAMLIRSRDERAALPSREASR